jgi:pyruvate/2-oxoacid:ferredoxin oxidoreductase alpha subunit
MKAVLKGNSAVARAVGMVRPQVISAYPITPQTSIIEELADMVTRGQLDAKFIKVESEHSAMAGCIAAASVGARVFTATSSHGLAYMHEMLHWAAGARLPVVMVNCNRALGPGWNLFADQTDSLSQRDTGWMQIYCASAQEVFDTIVQAYEVSQRTRLPSMVILDAFFLSHTYEDIELPEQDVVDRFLSPYALPNQLDLARPTLMSPVTAEDYYMEYRHKIAVAHEHALSEWQKADERWQAMTGRGYGLIEEYRNSDAEIVLVASSTIARTARVAIDDLRTRGIPAGLVRLRVFRPFPAAALQSALAGKKQVIVLDRNCSFGHHGIYHQEIKSALFDAAYSPRVQAPQVHGVIAGLGGRDVTPEDMSEIMSLAWQNKLTGPVTWWDTLTEKKPDSVLAAV